MKRVAGALLPARELSEQLGVLLGGVGEVALGAVDAELAAEPVIALGVGPVCLLAGGLGVLVRRAIG